MRNGEDSPALVVGIGPLGRHTGLHLCHDQPRPGGVLGYLRFADEPVHSRLPAKLLGTTVEIERVLREHVVSEVYIAGNGWSQRDAMQACIRTCERFGIPFALPVCDFRLDRARPVDADVAKDGYVHYASVRARPIQRAMKRAIDVVVSATALLLLAPVLIAAALLVKLTSRGPVLFRQERVGLHARAFHMLKLRSMVMGAEKMRTHLLGKNEQSGPVFKLGRDPRVTPVGRFLRKYSIDELPQLINVLRGEMSIVGPRPPLASEVARYEAWQRRRLSVRPGLTCVWQVSGRNRIAFDEWMYLDMQYIDNWSLAQDVGLIMKTVPVVLTGRGAS
jgi:exopolysaccharide biosynthesis polyprenyl glycosylphosphotransferase